MGKDIRWLHNLSESDFEAWRKARMDEGQKRYGDRDTGRYNLVDVAEELLDVVNIMERFENRVRVQGYRTDDLDNFFIRRIKGKAFDLLKAITVLDEYLPDELCTDENGGDRIWWGGNRDGK